MRRHRKGRWLERWTDEHSLRGSPLGNVAISRRDRRLLRSRASSVFRSGLNLSEDPNMDVSKLTAGTVYVSIHDVPYIILKLVDQTVTARCERGNRNNSFEIDLARFAAFMKSELLN